MPYLSDIQHRRVLDAGGDEIGRLKDLAILPKEQFPAVQWAILATGGGVFLGVPVAVGVRVLVVLDESEIDAHSVHRSGHVRSFRRIDCLATDAS